MEPMERRTSWTFVTNHARILAMIFRDPEIRLRDMAAACQVTERAALAIVTDLESAGYLTRGRRGRRNHYQVTPGTLFRHPAEGQHEIAELLRLLVALDPSGAPPSLEGPTRPSRPTRPTHPPHHTHPTDLPSRHQPFA